MKKLLPIVFVLISSTLFSQKKKNHKWDFFGIVQADIAFDLASLIKGDRNYDANEETYFSYGSQANIGYQPLNWFALSGGLRYAYVTPKYHNLLWNIQPYFIISDPEDEDKEFLTFSLGKQINNTQGIRENSFFGLGYGKTIYTNQHLAQKVQLTLDSHFIKGKDKILLIGISYGIIIFSNRNL